MEDFMEYINGFSHSGKKVTDLSRIESLLEDVGNPQDKLKFIHIAGTNGKGSVAEMFSEILTKSGYTTGLFTSPFIIEYNDRIRVNGENIPDSELAEITETVKKAVEKNPFKNDFSQFEITQAIAFLYFLKKKCEIVVLETGLGGLLDCTNVVKTSVLTVITSVDFDHTEILGDTLEKIAIQKAGIVKKNTPCILSCGNDISVIRIVREKCIENTSQLVIPNINLLSVKECTPFGSEFSYKGKNYRTSMGGAVQVLNAMTVIEGCNLLKESLGLSYENISTGIKSAVIDGRCQVICENPLTILDGAHNPDGIDNICGVISHCEKKPARMIIGMCRDKNISAVIKKLVPLVESFVCVDGFDKRATDKNELAQIITQSGGKARAGDKPVYEEISLMQKENPQGINIIGGSLYLVSYVKNIRKG